MSPQRRLAPGTLDEATSRRLLCAAAYLCLADVNRRVAAAKLRGDIGEVAGVVAEVMAYNRLAIAFSDDAPPPTQAAAGHSLTRTAGGLR